MAMVTWYGVEVPTVVLPGGRAPRPCGHVGYGKWVPGRRAMLAPSAYSA
jgi:hypothetical protein